MAVQYTRSLFIGLGGRFSSCLSWDADASEAVKTGPWTGMKAGVIKVIGRLCIFCAFLTFFLSCGGQGQQVASPAVPSHDSLEGRVVGVGMDADWPISAYVRRLFVDSEGRLWMATNGEGVLVKEGARLLNFSGQEGLAGQQVTAIIEPKPGEMWLATDGGVSYFDGHKFRNYDADDGLSSGRALSLLWDRKGQLWVGMTDGAYILRGDRFEPFLLPEVPFEPTLFSAAGSEAIYCLTEDVKGRIWIGTNGRGAFVYDGVDFQQFNTSNGLPDNSVSCILPDLGGRIWFGTMFGGVCSYDGVRYAYFNSKNGRLGDDESWTLMEDSQKRIWMSSEGYGLYRWDGQTLMRLGEEQGLRVGAVQCILEDGEGRIWAGGGGGLYRYDGMRFVEVLRGGDWWE